MELVHVSKVIVQTSPACQRKVTQTLIELGAVMRRLSSCPKGSDSLEGHTNPDTSEVVIEAEINAAGTNSLLQALGDVSSDGSRLSVSVLDVPATEHGSQNGEGRDHSNAQEVKWGDYIITI